MTDSSAATVPAPAPAPTAAEPAKKLRVIIGLPGNNFSSKFLVAWTQTLYDLWSTNQYEVMIAPGVSSFVSFARMKTLGLDVMRGKSQKPFNDLDYDVWITIDSDIVFGSKHIVELIEATKIHPVVSGMYMMSDMKHFACVKDWDEAFFAKYGSFQFLTPQDIETWQRETQSLFMPVSYNGMGFWAMTKQALNSLQYPFFDQELQRITQENGNEMVDMCGEDVAFCKNLQKAGYTIMLHTGLRVGHEKSVVL